MALFGLTIPEEHGGSAMNISQYARTVNAISYGGAGYRAEYGDERFFLDTHAYRICAATTQRLQLQIAKRMLREFHSGAMG